MAIYRSDQAQITFAAESAQGADPEQMKGTAAGFEGQLAGAHEAGSRRITVSVLSGSLTVGDFIRIGQITADSHASDDNVEYEIRRVERLPSATEVILDRPTSFYHPDNRYLYEITASSDEDINKYITFIPGVYESVDTPDPEMTIEGRHFLSTTSKRNWSVAYSGQQSLTGSVGGITLINGWPIRFPIGRVRSFPIASSTSSSPALTLVDSSSGDAKKGDNVITLTASTGLVVGDYIVIGYTSDDSNADAEVRRVVANPSGENWRLNYPLQFDHARTTAVRECTTASVYTHTITEENELDTVTWHVHMKDSSETATKNFDRRYVGGMIGSAVISAEEGGMLSMSWDSVNFLNMFHNQSNQITLASGGSSAPASGDDYYGASVAANMPRFALMQDIDSDDVGEPYHNGNGNNDGTGYPSTAPYYFSEGTIKFFGQTFAKIRGFSLSISNGEEPRYYIGAQGSRQRGPYEIREGAREYSMSATVVLPDADIASAATAVGATQTGALELFRQLLLEGDYGANSGNKKGFTGTLRFDRGTNDYIIIDIPTSSVAGSPSATTSGINSQGIFITSANHSIGEGTSMQVDLEMILRGVKITIVDGQPVYP
tara:strand:+ start:1501 stop:3312 length:1812 start_codon:yes stop_codon:yes gene_type:complete